MHPVITIKDKISQEVFYDFPIFELEKAYKQLAELEEMGLDVEISIPNVTQSLGMSLGLDKDQMDMLNGSMDDEINDHDGSCCVTSDSETKS